jgi:cupin superfamily acireductone dioxygenase involved in methionine salvage
MLTNANLSLMNDEQKNIVLTQWQKHQHEDFEVYYDVSGQGDMLQGFVFCRSFAETRQNRIKLTRF